MDPGVTSLGQSTPEEGEPGLGLNLGDYRMGRTGCGVKGSLDEQWPGRHTFIGGGSRESKRGQDGQ